MSDTPVDLRLGLSNLIANQFARRLDCGILYVGGGLLAVRRGELYLLLRGIVHDW